MGAACLLWSARLRNAHRLCQTSHRSLLSVKIISSGGGRLVGSVGGCFIGVFIVVGFGLVDVWSGGGVVCVEGVVLCQYFFSCPELSSLGVSFASRSNQLVSSRHCAIPCSAVSVDSVPLPMSQFHSRVLRRGWLLNPNQTKLWWPCRSSGIKVTQIQNSKYIFTIWLVIF